MSVVLIEAADAAVCSGDSGSDVDLESGATRNPAAIAISASAPSNPMTAARGRRRQGTAAF
jgi:hypothetical protein